MELPKVRVTSHALEQAMSRFPELRETYRQHGRIAVLLLLRAEVAAAIREGRRAVSEPRWCVFHSPSLPQRKSRMARGRRGKARWAKRYVWNVERTRAYVVVPERGVWHVLTTLAGQADPQAESING